VVKQVAALPDLIVPRQDGFWRLGVRTNCTAYDWMLSKRDHLFAVPVNQRPVVQGGVACADATEEALKNYDRLMTTKKVARRGKKDEREADDFDIANAKMHGAAALCESTSVEIKFANPRYIAELHSYNVECGVHPDGSYSYHMVRFESPAEPVPVSSGVGVKASEHYLKMAQQAVSDNAEEQGDKSGCGVDLDDKGWYIFRDKGRWLARGEIFIHRLCGAVDFNLPATFTQAVGIHENALFSLSTLRKSVPEAKDAFWSPRHDLLVVMTDSEFRVFKPAGAKLGPSVLTIPREELEVPVMAEWALGSSVARWSSELIKLQQQTLPEPLVQPEQK